MDNTARPRTFHFDVAMHEALTLKAVNVNCSVSDIVNDAVRAALAEDESDLKAFDERASEPVLSYDALIEDLQSHCKV